MVVRTEGEGSETETGSKRRDSEDVSNTHSEGVLQRRTPPRTIGGGPEREPP